MKNKFIWLGLSILLVAAMLLVSCSTSTTTMQTSTSNITTTNTSSITTKTTATIPTTTVTTTNNTTTTVAGNWWDPLGIPQYGGEITIALNSDIVTWDDQVEGEVSIASAYEDSLTQDDWTLNPSTFAFQLAFRPSNYEVGSLASDWEFTDPHTYVVHLRKNVYWQNIPPENGAQFTANDVVFHYDRFCGLGDGYTTPDIAGGASSFAPLLSVTATDNYTVVFKFNQSEGEEAITELLQGGGSDLQMEPPLEVQKYGNTNDWHNAAGTGPFLLTDFVDGSAATLIKNPNYWGMDERYPQNRLPYIDQLNILIIPDQSTALSALRSGKISAMDALSLSDATNMKKTNPEITQIAYPSGSTPTVDPRMDKAPFTDIRVRQAMQMAINLPEIASSLYANTCPPYPSSMTCMYMTGWNYPYQQWPADLKAQYDFNVAGAQQLLAAAGYSNGFNTDVVASNVTDLNLLQAVQSYLAAVKINMSITTMDPAAWTNYVLGHHADQLVYGGNSSGFTFPPLFGFHRWGTNQYFSWGMVSDPAWDALSNTATNALTTADSEAAVISGNKYMVQQHWVISLVTPNAFALCQPWLKGYNGQIFSISGGGFAGTGPMLLGFYAARFWIDKSVKGS